MIGSDSKEIFDIPVYPSNSVFQFTAIVLCPKE